MIWFIWLIWIAISIFALAFGFSKNIFSFKLFGSFLLILSGIIILSEGLSYESGFIDAYNYQCSPTCFENRSLSYNITDPMIQSIVRTPTYRELDKDEKLGLGLGVGLFFAGVYISIASSLDEVKARREKKKKGSLQIGEDE